MYLMPLICAMLCWEILDSAEMTCNDMKGGQNENSQCKVFKKHLFLNVFKRYFKLIDR